MAAKKTTAAAQKPAPKPQAKKAPAAKPAQLKVQDLKAATAASIQAVLGKGPTGRPGILTGFWIEDHALDQLGLSPDVVAKDVSKRASAASGVKLTPAVIRGEHGVLVGYRPPPPVITAK